MAAEQIHARTQTRRILLTILQITHAATSGVPSRNSDDSGLVSLRIAADKSILPRSKLIQASYQLLLK
jgi:hypothetical protein